MSMLRNAGYVFAGVFGAQLIYLATSPIITRMYGAESFGQFASVMGVAAILAPVWSLRYQLAIPLVRSEARARHLRLLALLIGLTVTLAALPLFLATSFNTGGDLRLALLGMAVLALTGAMQIAYYFGIRHRRYRALAVAKLGQGAGVAVGQIAAAPMGAAGLLMGQSMGLLAALLMLWPRHIRPAVLRIKRPALNMRAVARRYRAFPATSWGSLLDATAVNMPVLVLGAAFGPQAAGWYGLVQRVGGAPVGLIGRALSDALYGEAAGALNRDRLARAVMRVHLLLLAVGIGPAALVCVFGPDLFGLVFGKEWRQAGVYAALMTPGLLAQFVTSPLSLVYMALERQRDYLAFQCALFLAVAAGLVVGVAVGAPVWAIAAVSILSVCAYVWMFVRLLRLLGARYVEYLTRLLQRIIN